MIQGGHEPMPVAPKVRLPEDYRMPTGDMTPKELKKFGKHSDRILLSVYGDIFDVSHRPDKYGADGVYNIFAGKDITWGLISGVDIEENCNRFFDIFKAEDVVNSKMQGLASWLAFYEKEYGKPVGRLTPFNQ